MGVYYGFAICFWGDKLKEIALLCGETLLSGVIERVEYFKFISKLHLMLLPMQSVCQNTRIESIAKINPIEYICSAGFCTLEKKLV